MKDEFAGKKKRKKMENPLKIRFWVFAGFVAALFVLLICGLADLQLNKGADYAAQAGSSSIKRISVRGSRGMITDINSVVLARSEKVYNITFYRQNQTDWDYPTKMLLDAIEIIEKYGGTISVTSPLRRNADTGRWEFFFGSGISEYTFNAREDMFRSNNYLTSLTSYPDAASCFERLRQRYGFSHAGVGQYELLLDKDGNSIVLDLDGDETTAVECIAVSEENVLKVIAINVEMQNNIFNSTPVPIAEDVSYETVSEIEGRSMSMSWLGVTIGEKRVYPNGSLAANIIGYTGKIQSAEYYNSDLKPAGYAMNDYIGQAGIEMSMENWLTANITQRQGVRVVEIDPQGQITRELDYEPPQDGNTVKLTIDIQYQKMAETFIKNNVESTRNEQELRMQDSSWLETNKDKIAQRDWEEFPIKLAEHGVLLVMDVRDGTMKAMAQYPNYDLNAMVTGGAAAQEIVEDPRGLLQNYAIQTRAEPGSIFKMVTGLAALTNHELTLTETISDGGRFILYTHNFEDAPKCWTNYPQQHQNLDIAGGLKNSCNYFFYTLASRLYGDTGTERLYQYAAQMGLTKKTGIELPSEARSIVGNQTNLYDPTVSLEEQMTSTPILVAAKIKQHIRNYGASYGLEYDDARLDKCIKVLMDMALNTNQDNWVPEARKIFMAELAMDRSMVMQAALMSDLWNYLNTIKWGGSQEIQMGIGQSITLLTPIAVVRYVGALTNDAIVWNPQIVDSIVSPEGEVLSQRTPSRENILESAKEYMPKILEGLEGVVDETGTAGSHFRNWSYTASEVMYGKTGTSQVTIGKIRLDLENNGWFVALTPQENPEIAVVSFIANGLSGAYTTDAVRDFIGFYLDEKQKINQDISLPGGNSLAP